MAQMAQRGDEKRIDERERGRLKNPCRFRYKVFRSLFGAQVQNSRFSKVLS